MFDQLVDTATGSRGPAAVGAWARVENAACARRLFAMAGELEAMFAADGSEERQQWCLDNWDAVAAAIAAAQNVSLGVASHQLLIAEALRHRLPRVAEVFAAGAITYRMIAAVVARTRLIKDPEAMAKVDTEIAAHLVGWGPLSVDKQHGEIDYWVDRYDPAAVRRTEERVRGRHVDIHPPEDGLGTADIEARLLATDADALDQRLDAMAHAVCDKDPRTLDQRRSDALGAIGHGADHLTCQCDNPDCDAAAPQASAVLVHVIAHEDSLTDDTAVQFDGKEPRWPWPTGPFTTTAPTGPTEPPPAPPPPGPAATAPSAGPAATAPSAGPAATPPAGPAATSPAVILSGGILPAPLLAAKVAPSAKIVAIRHPGAAPPEPRYIPSAVLAWFVRCRDMTCRFPGCGEPAHRCDVDHTIAYPGGPTQASNLKCLCRKHHLLKTFWGWHDQQHPDGTVQWTSPDGQRYTTHPGSRILFPTLCQPTAPVTRVEPAAPSAGGASRGFAMPRRTQTRTQNRTQAINEERQHNEQALQAEAEQHARDREQRDDPGNACEDACFPSRPRPPSYDDPPPF